MSGRRRPPTGDRHHRGRVPVGVERPVRPVVEGHGGALLPGPSMTITHLRYLRGRVRLSVPLPATSAAPEDPDRVLRDAAAKTPAAPGCGVGHDETRQGGALDRRRPTPSR